MLTQADNAILVVDMQNDWVLPSSPLHVAGVYATLPAIAKFLDYGRANGWAVIYIYRIYRPSGIDAELFRRYRGSCQCEHLRHSQYGYSMYSIFGDNEIKLFIPYRYSLNVCRQ